MTALHPGAIVAQAFLVFEVWTDLVQPENPVFMNVQAHMYRLGTRVQPPIQQGKKILGVLNYSVF